MNLWELITAKLYKWYKGHEGNADAHHTKYTDANAVSAVETADKYLKNTKDICTDKLTISTDSLEDIGSGAFHLIEENDATRFRAISYSNTFWHSPTFIFAKARGTAGARTYPLSGEVIGSILGQGWSEGANTWKNCTNIEYTADGNWSNGNYPAQLAFKTGTGGDVFNRLLMKSDGKIGIGTDSPTALVDVNSNIIRLRTAKTPASAAAAGNQGDICWDTNYLYICTAANAWKRVAIVAW